MCLDFFDIKFDIEKTNDLLMNMIIIVGMLMEVRAALLLKVDVHASVVTTANAILATVKRRIRNPNKKVLVFELCLCVLCLCVK